MHIVECQDAIEWNKALAAIPQAHVLQAWEWGELKAKYGWTPRRWLWVENGATQAAAQVLRRPLPRTPLGVMYVPKGPALDYGRTALLESVLGDLEQQARRERAIFIKADPDIRVDTPGASTLPARGWRFSAEQIQYRNTVALDLTRSEDDLLAAMKPKWRYNIRLAAKKGVHIEAGTEADLPAFYDLYAETSARDGFLIRPFSYYRQVWTAFLRANLAHILLARVEGQCVAGIILFRLARRAWYFYGASRNTHRDWMPNHLLQWEAVRWARGEGCAEYDFWGAPNRLAEGEPMYGVYKFKMGFGGEFVERIGAFDYVVNRPLYYLYAVVRPRYLARLRRRH
ncbi:MAG: peptidoglycan bridge formation glycyltransferase FemA/FemB family protein, partial [Anaerolineae bacterium]